MSQLATMFESLRRDNGEPDDQARRTELEALLEHLTLPEIRRLRILLGQMPVCDVCDFPPEVAFRILALLPLEEILSLKAVCRTWNFVLSSSEFCHQVAKEHFRPHWEQRNRDVAAGITQAYHDCFDQWFQRSAIRRLRKQHGKYSSKAAYSYQHFQPDPITLPIQYSNGRVGVRVDAFTLRVQNLRLNHDQRSFIDETRAIFEQWLLSDSFLIASKLSPTTLLAWALNSDDPPYRVRLPNKVVAISANENRVAVVTGSWDVYVWTIGNSLRQLDTSTMRPSIGYLTNGIVVVWDSQVRTRLSVIFEGYTDKTYVFVITKYDNFVPMSTHSIRFDTQEFAGPTVACKVLDLRDGIIGMPSVRGLGNAFNTDHCFKDPQILVFNTYTNKFNWYVYHLAKATKQLVYAFDWPDLLLEFHFWRDQVLVPISTEPGEPPAPYSRDKGGAWVVAAAWSPAEHEETQFRRYHIHDVFYNEGIASDERGEDSRASPSIALFIPIQGAPDSSMSEFTAANAAYFDLLAKRQGKETHKYILETAQEDIEPRAAAKHLETGYTVRTSKAVLGDDDFVLLCGEEGFVVWCFDKDVKLPNAFP